MPVDSHQNAMIASQYAERLEVCDDLASDGWTPNPEMLSKIVKDVSPNTAVVSLIRPRPLKPRSPRKGGLTARDFTLSYKEYG